MPIRRVRLALGIIAGFLVISSCTTPPVFLSVHEDRTRDSPVAAINQHGYTARVGDFVYQVKASECTYPPDMRFQTGVHILGKPGIVTALHGVLGCDSLLAVAASSTNPDKLNVLDRLEIVEVDIARDIALIAPVSSILTETLSIESGLRTSISMQYPDCSSDRPSIPIRMWGYPHPNLISRTGGVICRPQLRHRFPHSHPERAKLEQRRSPLVSISILDVDIDATYGFSGGPIIHEESHEVLGIIIGGLSDLNIQNAWAVPWTDIEWQTSKIARKALDDLAEHTTLPTTLSVLTGSDEQIQQNQPSEPIDSGTEQHISSLPSVTPGVAQVLVATFEPPNFSQYDAAGAIVTALQNEIAGGSNLVQVIRHDVIVHDDAQAREIACQLSDGIVVWGSSQTNSTIVNYTSCYDKYVARRIYPDLVQNGYAVLSDIEIDAPFIASIVLGRLYFTQERFADVKSIIGKAIRRVTSPTRPQQQTIDGLDEAYLLRGNALLSEWKHNEAAADYILALEIDYELSEARYNYAIAQYFGQNDSAAAVRELDTLLELDPGYRNAYVFRGSIFAVLATEDEEPSSEYGLRAIEDFSEIISGYPDNHAAIFDAILNRAILLHRLDMFDEARSDLDRVLGANLDCSPVYKTEILQAEQNDGDLWCGRAANELAELYVDSLDINHKDAVELAELATDKLESTLVWPYAMDTLAKSYAKVHRCEDAAQTIHAALDYDSSLQFLVETQEEIYKICPEH